MVKLVAYSDVDSSVVLLIVWFGAGNVRAKEQLAGEEELRYANSCRRECNIKVASVSVN